jgi:hypothetical protein
MKIAMYFSLFLVFCACGNSTKKTGIEETEDEFVAPKNPFSDSDKDSFVLDTSGKAKKAEKPGMKPAKIEFKNKEIIFDTIPAGKIFKSEIEFYNSGEQALEILSVKSSKQADISWSSLLIAASETNRISYKIKAPEKKGIFRDTITIVSNAVEEKLLLKGTIR